MVASLDGASAWKSRSAGLSGQADQTLLAVLRALADVILVGRRRSVAKDTDRPMPIRTSRVPALPQAVQPHRRLP